MHLGIFGVAGSGKTTLAKIVADKYPPYSAVSASRLISSLGGAIDFKSLHHDSVESNQDILVYAYNKYKVDHPCTLIELHSLIEMPDGVDDVDVAIIRALNLDAAFFLVVPGLEILRRRSADVAKSRRRVSVSELEELQQRSLDNVRLAFFDRVILLTPEDAMQTLENFICGRK
jgi:adenylate kinase